jgi:hypothetical protein
VVVRLAARGLSTPYDVFHEKERADESMWIARHEKEYAEHLKFQRELEAKRQQQKRQQAQEQEPPAQLPGDAEAPKGVK